MKVFKDEELSSDHTGAANETTTWADALYDRCHEIFRVSFSYVVMADPEVAIVKVLHVAGANQSPQSRSRAEFENQIPAWHYPSTLNAGMVLTVLQ